MMTIAKILLLATVSYHPDIANRYISNPFTNDWRFSGRVISKRDDGLAIRLEDMTYALAMSGERRFLVNPFETFQPHEIQSNYFETSVSYGMSSPLPYEIMHHAISEAASNCVGRVNEDLGRTDTFCFTDNEASPPSDFISRQISDETTFSDILRLFGCSASTNIPDEIIGAYTNMAFRFPFTADDVIATLSASSSSNRAVAATASHYEFSEANFSRVVSHRESSDVSSPTNWYPNFSYGDFGTSDTSTNQFQAYYIGDLQVRVEYSRFKTVLKVWDLKGTDEHGDPIWEPRDSSVSSSESLYSAYQNAAPSFEAWRFSDTNSASYSPAIDTVRGVYGMMYGNAYSMRRKTYTNYAVGNSPSDGTHVMINETTLSANTNSVRFICQMIFDKEESVSNNSVFIVSSDSMKTIAQEVFDSVLNYNVSPSTLKPNLETISDPTPFYHGEGINTEAIAYDELVLYIEPVAIVIVANINPETEYKR